MTGRVNWLELFPDEFKARQRSCPLAYLPLGMCEPHGQISVFGLDTFKAEYLAREAAERWGGIVAPTMNYHIHEIGPSARFLEERVGETNPHMTSVPSYVFMHFFLYQLRSLHNASFRAAVVLSGHGGAHPDDLRRAAGLFARRTGMRIWLGTDFELARPYAGDHAGKYEISFLMHLHPQYVDMGKRALEAQAGSGGRLAVGDDADEASPEYGRQIAETCLDALREVVRELLRGLPAADEEAVLSFAETERMWRELLDAREEWATLRPRSGQTPVSAASRWKQGEIFRL